MSPFSHLAISVILRAEKNIVDFWLIDEIVKHHEPCDSVGHIQPDGGDMVWGSPIWAVQMALSSPSVPKSQQT